MITENHFYNALNTNEWKLVDENHPLKIYYGKDINGRFALEFIGEFKVNKNVKSSALIDISYHKNKRNEKSMVISLIESTCLKQFCIFCNDIIESTSNLNHGTKLGYESICNLYFTWQKMFRNHSDLLSEAEIKGLIGELIFLKREMFSKVGVSDAVLCWTGPDATKKDFSIDNTWFEIKTIDFGKTTVKISSLEQLDSVNEGSLVVYQLERMAPEYHGLSLNQICNDILSCMTSLADKDLFLEKLQKVGFVFSPQYDNYVYEFRNKTIYKVDRSFPKLTHDTVQKAIEKATYELSLIELSNHII